MSWRAWTALSENYVLNRMSQDSYDECIHHLCSPSRTDRKVREKLQRLAWISWRLFEQGSAISLNAQHDRIFKEYMTYGVVQNARILNTISRKNYFRCNSLYNVSEAEILEFKCASPDYFENIEINSSRLTPFAKEVQTRIDGLYGHPQTYTTPKFNED